MREADKLEYISRYEARLLEYGYDPRTLGWGKGGRQAYRFKVLSEIIVHEKDSAVLDVGCGFADLYEFLTKVGWSGTYTGIDIVPGLVKHARDRFPFLDIRNIDIADLKGEQFNFAVASGIFNARLISSNNLTHIEKTVELMLSMVTNAVCVDFMTSKVDFQQETAWHTDPTWAVGMALRKTNRFILRNDYMPYEFALLLFKDQRISDRNLFKAFEDEDAIAT
jgi:SAM-dependent methyltransferase